MAYKLVEAAQAGWWPVTALPSWRSSAPEKFGNGKLAERPDDTTATDEAAYKILISRV